MSEKKPTSRTTYLFREMAGIAIAGIGIAEGLKLSKTHYNRGLAVSSGALTAGLWLYLYSDSQVKCQDDPDRWLIKHLNHDSNDIVQMVAPIEEELEHDANSRPLIPTNSSANLV